MLSGGDGAHNASPHASLIYAWHMSPILSHVSWRLVRALTLLLLFPHAALVLRAFSRRIATDKFIQLFFVLNFGALLGIIVWYAVKKGKISPPKIVTPPPPSFTGSAAHVHIGPPLDIPEHARKYLR